MRTDRSRRGFTLIELLVVIAVIAIIAAFLFPVFAQARDKARQAACLSNMKQIGAGVMMYAQDYDEKLPFGYQYHWDASGQMIPGRLDWWQDLCRPYVKNEAVYSCPSASPHFTMAGWRPPGAPDPLIRDYIANAQWGFTQEGPLMIDGHDYGRSAGLDVSGVFTNNWNTGYSVSLAEIEHTAGTIAIFDGRYTEVWRGEQTDAYYNATGNCSWWRNLSASGPDPSDCEGCWWKRPAPDAEICKNGHVAKRHNDGFVATFVDGHAKWIRNSTLGMWTRRGDD